MATARDWLKTLWNASYKGMPFYIERDEEEGGRRIVVHQFPMRDVPFNEDLGEDRREFEVIAYVVSDNADNDAGTLVATCATRGPGVLVLPTHGPILVRCLTFTRDRAKDRHGYIGFRLRFIREGASSPLVTTALLANLVFIAADAAALAAAAAFVAGVQIQGQPDFVVAAASGGAETAVSAMEAIRTSEPVDPIVSSVQRDEIQSIFDHAPTLIADPATIETVPTRIVATGRALADAMPATAAISAFGAVLSEPWRAITAADAFSTPRRRAAAVNDAEAMRLLRLAAIIAYCEAVTRMKLTDRPAGITLRANVAEYLEGELESMRAAEIDLYHSIAALRDAVIEYLTRAIIDLAPVRTAEANLLMPSLFWAWRLYGDPNRATELVSRNRVPHPSFMPSKFEFAAPAK